MSQKERKAVAPEPATAPITPEIFEASLQRLEADIALRFSDKPTEHALRHANATLTGPQGDITQLLKQIPALPIESRKALGKQANLLKREVQAQFEQALKQLHEAELQQELEGGHIDVTLPGKSRWLGSLHPLTRVTYDLIALFRSMGFGVAEGPHIEWSEYNFEKLAFPPDHPATDMQDSFFIRSEKSAAGQPLLRTHTSTVQVRHMMANEPPFAIISPGAVYRRDDDVTHSPMFFQLEGLMVGKEINFAHLKGVLTLFVQRFFGDEVPLRFRPSYFPFVEPGAEVDMGCTFCKPWIPKEGPSEPCRVCKDTGWLEILGCGMVHPEVFEHVGYDPEQWRGFAFGMGIDRIAMLRYGVADIRLFYENDLRFLSS